MPTNDHARVLELRVGRSSPFNRGDRLSMHAEAQVKKTRINAMKSFTQPCSYRRIGASGITGSRQQKGAAEKEKNRPFLLSRCLLYLEGKALLPS